MLKLIVDNSVCQLVGFNLSQFKEIRKVLSYTESVRGRFGYQSKIVHLMDKRGFFPTGLLPYVVEYLKNIPHEINDRRIKPKKGYEPLNLKLPYKPYDDQLNALEALQREDFKGVVTLPTGAGKSVVCALIINALKVKTLVVVPSLELKNQLTASLRQQFGNDKVGPLNKAGHPDFPISVENVDALKPSVKPKGIDLVIIDELHRAASNTYRKLNQKAWVNIFYRCGMTATFFRNKDEEQLLLESILSKVVFQVDYKRAVEMGYIVPLQVFYYDIAPMKPKGNQKSYQSMYAELIVNREDRNNQIADLVLGLDDAGESTLVLLKEIKHGQLIKDALEAKGKAIAFANGENDQNRIILLEFNLKERNTLIATGVLGEGIDTKPCSYVILAGAGKSKPQMVQNIGRCLRVFAGKEVGTVIIIRDSSHKWFLDHAKAIAKHLKDEYGVVGQRL